MVNELKAVVSKLGASAPWDGTFPVIAICAKPFARGFALPWSMN